MERRAMLGASLSALWLCVPALARAGGGDSADSAWRLSDAAWRQRLAPAAYAILRQGGTEPPWTSPLLHEHRRGRFACAGCDLALFASDTKFDSGTGWPSFWQALPGAVARLADRSYGMERTEVRCHRCAGHLGHLFDDGPRPTGLRYCMNGAALQFHPEARR